MHRGLLSASGPASEVEVPSLGAPAGWVEPGPHARQAWLVITPALLGARVLAFGSLRPALSQRHGSLCRDTATVRGQNGSGAEGLQRPEKWLEEQTREGEQLGQVGGDFFCGRRPSGVWVAFIPSAQPGPLAREEEEAPGDRLRSRGSALAWAPRAGQGSGPRRAPRTALRPSRPAARLVGN